MALLLASNQTKMRPSMSTPVQSVNQCPACLADAPRFAFESAAQMHPSAQPFSFSRCRECDLLFLSSRPLGAALKDFYPDTYLPYLGERAWGLFAPLVKWDQNRLDDRRVKAVLNAFALSQSSRVLDVGCGKPTFLKRLQEKHGAECWGVDFNVSGWRNEEGMQALHLVEGDVVSAPLSGTFDVITLWHYLEHDPSPLETLRYLRRFSNPRTVLLVEVPNVQALSHRVFGARWAGLHTPRHMALYSPGQLEQVLKRCGWSVTGAPEPGTLGAYLLWWLSLREVFSTQWNRSMVRYLPGFLLWAVCLSPVLALHAWTKDTVLLKATASDVLAKGG